MARSSFRPALCGLWLPLLCACRPTAGSSCEVGEARCLDATHELSCEDGRFVETPCRGKGGCLTRDEATACDISANRAGDPCGKADEGAATCSGPSEMLACRGGHFVSAPCRGARGCSGEGGRAVCDQSLAAESDACREEDAKACSSDGKRVLVCRGHARLPLYECRGPAGCTAQGGKLGCDQTVARLADACDAALEGHVACNEERAGVLACRQRAFVTDETCKAGSACSVDGQRTRCEQHAK